MHAKIKRSPADLRLEFREQIEILRNLCSQYDQGLEVIGKTISASLRVLLLNRGRSRSLFSQLGLLHTLRYVDSAGTLAPNIISPRCTLIATAVGDNHGRYLPLVATPFRNKPPQLRRFPQWWSAPVLEVRSLFFSRERLICEVAETDGGAHVDPSLFENYFEFSRNNSLGSKFVQGSSIQDIVNQMATDRGTDFGGRPELCCMRQIAHEILSTLHRRPEFEAFSEPVLPTLA